MSLTLSRTTLASAISYASDGQMLVLSATGMSVGNGLYIDREFMRVTGITGNFLQVARGQKGTRATPHAKGANVFFGPQHYFTESDKFGAGTAANENVQPWLNIMTGDFFSVVGGVWVKNNTYGGSTNYGLSPAIWADCPLELMMRDPGYGVYDGDDFIGASGSPLVTAHKYTLAGANGTIGAVASVVGGAAILTAPGTDNEAFLIGTNGAQIKCDASTTWWLEARLKINQITTAQGVFFGLASEAGADFMTDNTMALKVVDILGFQIIAATDIAAVWQSMHSLTSGARAAVNATLLTASTSYVKLGMKSVAGTVTFYVDGVPDSSTVLSSATNFPLNKYLFAVFATKCGTATANTLTVDWWKLATTRIAN